MKTIVLSGFYYLLILVCCLAGAYLAGKSAFQFELIFVVYVSMTIYAIVEIIFSRVPLVKGKNLLLRVVFLAVCFLTSYLLLVTPEEMILEKELGGSLPAFEIIDIDMKPASVGYLVNIKFTVSQEKFLDLVTSLGFQKRSLTEINFRDEALMEFRYDWTDKEDAVLCFVKDENLEHSYFGTRCLVYDIETMTAYYEYLNHKGVYH